MSKTSKTPVKYIILMILLWSFYMMPVSEAVEHATHERSISHTWSHLHILFAVTFIVAGVYLVVSNWRKLKFYLSNPKKD